MKINIYPWLFLFFFILTKTPCLAQLKADFKVNHTTDCSPAILLFSDLSTGGPTTWSWDFGNGVTSSLQDPGVTYSTAGKYPVKLTVTKGSNTSTETKAAYIEIFDPPVAGFGSDIAKGCAPLNIAFTDKSTKGTGTINSWLWDFGDGNTSSDQNPLHTYSSGGTYRVTLIVKDKNGCSATFLKNAFITVYQPAADFSASKVFSCSAPLSVSFSDSSKPKGSYTYAWDFGDLASGTISNTSSVFNPSHTFVTAGKYTVKLKITDINGCSNTKSITDYINIGSLKAGFSFVRKDSCLPVNVAFTNTSTPELPGVAYLWDFGDGGSDLSQNPDHTYTAGGPYPVKLIIRYGSSCTDTIVRTVTIPQGPKAAFSADVATHCKIPATVKFTDASSGAVSWTWDFGDLASYGSNTSTSQNPTHTYNTEDSYDVNLVIKNNSGCIDSLVKKSYILIKKPVFSISATPPEGCKPLKVSFSVHDSSIVPITKWNWDLGDGNTSSSTTPVETYNDTGVYIIKLTGTTASGCSATFTDTVKAGIPPRAKFTANKFIGCRDQMNVQFTDQTNDTTVKANEWLWDFGDKKTSTDQNPSHIYSDTGFFTVKLISLYNGCPGTVLTKTNYIYIYPPVALTEDTFISCQGAPVQFTEKSIGADSWHWDFGDGDSSLSQKPKYKYPAPGIYYGKLTVYHKTNTCSSKKAFVVVVTKARPVSFYGIDTSGCSPLTTHFRAATSWAKSWSWDFGDPSSSSNTSTDSSASFTYVSAGNYTVSLNVSDSFGCPYSGVKPKYISGFGGNANFSFTPSGGCLPLTVNLKDISGTAAPVSKRTWYLGNGISFDSKGTDTSYTYSGLPFNYVQKFGLAITLVLEDAHGCSYLRSRTAKPSMPLPQFKITAVKKCGYDSIVLSPKLDDTTVIKPWKISWDFGNGTYSQTDTPTVKLSGKKDLDIKMVLTDANGCKDSVEQAYKLNTTSPVADFAALSIPQGCPPVVIDFEDSSKMGGTAIKSYKWDFGDGTGSTVASPSKTYTIPGKYSVRLAITDATGCTDLMLKKDFVNIKGPDGTYTIDKTKGCTPFTVNLTGKSNKAALFVWDMGDGTILKTATVNYTYHKAGVYQPHLRVTDSSGCEVLLPEKDSITVYSKPEPDFSAAEPSICPGQIVRFNNLTPLSDSVTAWKWYFGDGDSSSAKEPANAYPAEGSYTVTLLAFNRFGCNASLVKKDYITVKIDTVPPKPIDVYRVTVLDNQQPSLEFAPAADTAFSGYKIMRQAYPSAESDVKDFADINDTIYNDIADARPQSYCYRVAVTDACGNISYSPKHCTVELKASCDTDGIHLSWTPYTGWQALSKYEIYRKKASAKDFTLLEYSSPDSLTYLDKDVNCREFCIYRIKAIEKGGLNQTSSGDTAAAIAGQHGKPAISNIKRVTVDVDKVLIEWEIPANGTNYSFQLERSVDGISYASFRLFGDSISSFEDNQVDVANTSYYYRVRLYDHCTGITGSPGRYGRTIVLKAENTSAIAGEPETQPRLSWNPYSLWENGISYYEIEILKDNNFNFGYVNKTDSATRHFIHEDLAAYKSPLCYRVNAYKYNDETIISRSNMACLTYTGQLFAPNAFSPNDNGINELFFLKGLLISEYKLQIYNRWGELIFETTNLNKGWDGTFKGQKCMEGMYMYLVFARPQNSLPLLMKGTIQLLR